MNKNEIEELQEKILADIYSGTFSGTPAMILDERKLKMHQKKNWNKLQRNMGINV